jgi:peptidoglycan/xylan/chitin deacetylase (PgdA/CDA1 family)
LTDVLVLCYHAVSERWPATLSVTPAKLERHVALLAERGYDAVTFHDVVARSRAGKTVAITFDDAYRSVFDLALPILSKVGFPATVFAPTAFIGSGEPMAWPGIDGWLDSDHAHELLPMSWSELGVLAEAGWEIGSHTRSHPRLPDSDQTTLDRELRDSRLEIEDRLRRPCLSLAYPFGLRNEHVIEAARCAGYVAAARTARGRFRSPTSTLDWPRIVVTRQDGERRFRLKVSPLLRRLRASPGWMLLVHVRRGGFGRLHA